MVPQSSLALLVELGASVLALERLDVLVTLLPRPAVGAAVDA